MTACKAQSRNCSPSTSPRLGVHSSHAWDSSVIHGINGQNLTGATGGKGGPEGRNLLVFKSHDLRYSCNNNRAKGLVTNQSQQECRTAKAWGGGESVGSSDLRRGGSVLLWDGGSSDGEDASFICSFIFIFKRCNHSALLQPSFFVVNGERWFF